MWKWSLGNLRERKGWLSISISVGEKYELNSRKHKNNEYHMKVRSDYPCVKLTS